MLNLLFQFGQLYVRADLSGTSGSVVNPLPVTVHGPHLDCHLPAGVGLQPEPYNPNYYGNYHPHFDYQHGGVQDVYPGYYTTDSSSDSGLEIDLDLESLDGLGEGGFYDDYSSDDDWVIRVQHSD